MQVPLSCQVRCISDDNKVIAPDTSTIVLCHHLLPTKTYDFIETTLHLSEGSRDKSGSDHVAAIRTPMCHNDDPTGCDVDGGGGADDVDRIKTSYYTCSFF